MNIRVAGQLDDLRRTFWKDPESGASKAGHKKPKRDLIVSEETAWSLDKETRVDTGEPFNLLMVCMVKREPTESERTYKRGRGSFSTNEHQVHASSIHSLTNE